MGSSWRSCGSDFRDRPDLDGAELRARDAGRELDRLIQVPRLQQVVATQLLLGLGERAVRGREPALPHPDRGRRVRRLQGVAADIVSALLDRLRVGVELAD